jgi:hypothetical protein
MRRYLESSFPSNFRSCTRHEEAYRNTFQVLCDFQYERPLHTDKLPETLRVNTEFTHADLHSGINWPKFQFITDSYPAQSRDISSSPVAFTSYISTHKADVSSFLPTRHGDGHADSGKSDSSRSS